MKEYLSYKEAMEYMGFKNHISLSKYISNGLPTIQVGKSKRISRKAIDKFMDEHTVTIDKAR